MAVVKVITAKHHVCFLLLVRVAVASRVAFPPSTVEVQTFSLSCSVVSVLLELMLPSFIDATPRAVQCLARAEDPQQLCMLKNVAVWQGKIYVIYEGRGALYQADHLSMFNGLIAVPHKAPGVKQCNLTCTSWSLVPSAHCRFDSEHVTLQEL